MTLLDSGTASEAPTTVVEGDSSPSSTSSADVPEAANDTSAAVEETLEMTSVEVFIQKDGENYVVEWQRGATPKKEVANNTREVHEKLIALGASPAEITDLMAEVEVL